MTETQHQLCRQGKLGDPLASEFLLQKTKGFLSAPHLQTDAPHVLPTCSPPPTLDHSIGSPRMSPSVV